MPLKVLFNNSCSVCRIEINHYKKISNNNFQWIDITHNIEAQKMTSKSDEELLRRLHVVYEGKVLSGAEAFMVLWSKIPRYQFLYKILKFKIFFIIFHYTYEFIAYLLFLKNKNQLKKTS